MVRLPISRQVQQPSDSRYLLFLWQLDDRCACWPVHRTWRFCWPLPGSSLHLPLWDSDIRVPWLASGRWNQCAAVWEFPILQNLISQFLCCRNLRPFQSSPQNIIDGAVSLLPFAGRSFTSKRVHEVLVHRLAFHRSRCVARMHYRQS